MWQSPPFRLDVVNQSLYRGEVRIPLMPKPFAVLQYLVENAGRLVSQNELMEAVWPETHVQPEVLRRSILEIRRALGDQPETPRFIETVTKRGYRFIAEVSTNELEPVALEPPPARSPRQRKIRIAVAILASGILLGGGFLLRRSHRPRLTEKDTIVLADVIN